MNRRILFLLIGLAMVAGAVVLRVALPRDRPTRTPVTQRDPRAARAPATSTEQAAAPATDVVFDEDTAGTLRLEGQVIDADARPVGGAVVTIDTRPERTATTEADGSFAFDRLLGRPYELVATSGELVAGPVVAHLGAATDPVVLRLGRGADVQVTVVSAGAAVATARVDLRGLVDRTATADASGIATFRGVPPGGYLIAAAAPSHAQASTYGWIGTGSASYRIELRRGASVSGRVVDPAGRPVAGARVRYEGASDWTQAATDPVTTAADGAFHVDALPAGSFRFTARHAEHAPGTTEAVTLDGVSARTGITIRLAPGAAIAGVVVDRGGTPVAWARIRAAAQMPGIQMQKTRETTADDAGRFRLAGLPRGRVDVVAMDDHAASETTTLEVDAAERAGIELVLALAGRIAGVVVDSTGEPIEGAQIWAWPDEGTTTHDESRLRGRDQTLTDAAGGFAFHGLRPGRYELRTTPPGASANLGMTLLRAETLASVGDAAVRIVLPADGSITGTVAFEDGRHPPFFTVGLGGWGSSVPVSSKDGSFTVDGVPARRDYRVTIRGPEFAERALPTAVDPGKTAELGTIIVAKGRTISGRVVDGGGHPVAGATVLAGAILFGTGTTPRAPDGFGGPPGTGVTKDTTTNAHGEFTLIGVGRGPRHLVADHDTLGRSIPISLPSTTESAMNLQLVLVPFGALEGTVRMDRKPAERVIVTAQSKTVPEAMFSVITGADGAYRFDRLAADRYLVSAMLGDNPMSGFGFHSQTVTVASGPATRADLVIDAGGATLVVTPVAGARVDFALIESFKGTFTATIHKDLDRQAIARDQGTSSLGMAFGGNPARIEHLAPGVYTVCACPYPDEVGMLDGEDYMLREGDNLPVFCKPVTVTERAGEQPVEIQVTLPPYVPPPPDDEPAPPA